MTSRLVVAVVIVSSGALRCGGDAGDDIINGSVFFITDMGVNFHDCTSV